MSISNEKTYIKDTTDPDNTPDPIENMENSDIKIEPLSEENQIEEFPITKHNDDNPSDTAEKTAEVTDLDNDNNSSVDASNELAVEEQEFDIWDVHGNRKCNIYCPTIINKEDFLEEGPHICPICPTIILPCEHVLKDHMRLVHGHQQISPQHLRTSNKVTKTPSSSPSPKSTKVSPQSTTTTIVNNNNNNVTIKLDDKKRFKCDICGASYKHLRNLRAHCHLHTGKTKCDLCNKVLCNRSYFRKHLLHQHGIAENPYEDGDDLDLSQHHAQLMSHSVFENQLEEKDGGSEEEDILQEENLHTLSHSVFD